MANNSPSGIVVVGEMQTVTLSMGMTVVVIDRLIVWYVEMDAYLSGVNKLMHVHAGN